MTFKRPDMGHPFNWMLEDPKTYTRPIKNERVFVLSPGSRADGIRVHGKQHGHAAGRRSPRGWHRPTIRASFRRMGMDSFDLTKPQKFTGVIKELKWERDALAIAKIEAGGKRTTSCSVPRFGWISAAWPRRRSPRQVGFVPGPLPSKQNPNELRAQTLTVGKVTRDMR